MRRTTIASPALHDRVPPALHARLGDLGCMLIALVLGSMAADATDVASGAYAPVNDLVGLAAIAALWWRRRFPAGVPALTFLAAAASPLAGGAAVVGVYTVAAHHRSPTALVPAGLYGVHLLTGVIGLLLFPDEELGSLGNALAGLVLAVAAVGWGLATRSRAALLAALAERAQRAEADQQARVAEARRAERARIAAEMHDVLAHRLSLLSLHAGAIEFRAGGPPEALARAAGVVRANAHAALEDLRAVIGVLRDDTPGARAPQPTLTALDALVAESREAGMDLEVDRGGLDLAAVPTDVGLHGYRVVREALTNARKHAPGRPVRLTLAGTPGDCLRIEVVNPLALPSPGATATAGTTGPAVVSAVGAGTVRAPGPGAGGPPVAGAGPAPASTRPNGPAPDPAGGDGAERAPAGGSGAVPAEGIPGAGTGLIGLRERVEVAGGTLTHGVDGDGRHRLTALLPWPA